MSLDPGMAVAFLGIMGKGHFLSGRHSYVDFHYLEIWIWDNGWRTTKGELQGCSELKSTLAIHPEDPSSVPSTL